MAATRCIRAIVLITLCSSASCSQVPKTKWVGVSEAGLEFGSKAFPGIPFKDYVQPTNDSVAYFVEQGMNFFRLPFIWERIQPTLMGDLDPAYSALVDGVVNGVLSHPSASVLLDVHNYARYRGSVIGESGGNVTAADFADLWKRLAERWGSNDKNSRVLFGLMNEPHDMKTTTIVDNTNQAIAAIRQTKSMNLITICGNRYSGARAWFSGANDSNAAHMGDIRDSEDNFVFEMHQYLDHDSSGSHTNCTLQNASVAMSAATNWLRTNKKKAILGEFAGANNAGCKIGIDSMFEFLTTNADVWVGWSWWAAGPWWGPYMFSIEPNPPCSKSACRDKPQEAWIKPYLLPTTNTQST